MPIYAYQCQDCRHDVEVLQKISDPALTECPACHRPGLVKQVTAAGFQLKGTGWYATDFRANGTKPREPKAETKSTEGEAKSDAKVADGSGTAATAATASDAAPAAPAPAPASSPGPAAS